MKRLDANELSAMLRLALIGDFDIFLGWIRSSLAEVTQDLAYSDDAAMTRLLQGEARVLREMLDAFAHAGETLDRLTAAGRGKPLTR